VLGSGPGLRQAETAGLTADRIDWLGRSVLIDRQWTSQRGVCGFGPPKTDSSHRTIPASVWVLDALSEHVGRQHDGFVLHPKASLSGTAHFNGSWVRACAGGGVAGMGFHDPRHAFAVGADLG
jgi:integrase